MILYGALFSLVFFTIIKLVKKNDDEMINVLIRRRNG